MYICVFIRISVSSILVTHSSILKLKSKEFLKKFLLNMLNNICMFSCTVPSMGKITFKNVESS